MFKKEFNQRKSRKSAFWDNRYHAIAVSTEHHHARCLTYINLNMVRAGIVKDPGDWPESGYAETIKGRQRYQLLDHGKLADLLDLPTPEDVRLARQRWVAESLK